LLLRVYCGAAAVRVAKKSGCEFNVWVGMTSSFPGVSFEFDPPRSTKPALAFLQDYWNAKRGARTIPSRADINPAEMKAHIRAIVLVDALPGFDDFRYRMIGSDVTEHMLGDATGKTLREAFIRYGEAATEGAIAGFAHVARSKVILRLHGSAAWLNQPHLDFDSLHVPLSDDGENVNMIMSAVTFSPRAGIKG
jgi:hypothetical protein